jgi:predicted transporter
VTRLRSFAATARQARQAVATTVAILIFGSSSVFACPVCFGAEETSMITASKLGVLVLVGITLAVQGAFAAFFFYLRKRAKLIADADLDNEWSELQGSPKTS